MTLGRFTHIGITTSSIALAVFASAAKQSSVPGDGLDCFAALATTKG